LKKSNIISEEFRRNTSKSAQEEGEVALPFQLYVLGYLHAQKFGKGDRNANPCVKPVAGRTQSHTSAAREMMTAELNHRNPSLGVINPNDTSGIVTSQPFQHILCPLLPLVVLIGDKVDGDAVFGLRNPCLELGVGLVVLIAQTNDIVDTDRLKHNFTSFLIVGLLP
jgi:hypothetical protein